MADEAIHKQRGRGVRIGRRRFLGTVAGGAIVPFWAGPAGAQQVSPRLTKFLDPLSMPPTLGPVGMGGAAPAPPLRFGSLAGS